MSISFLPGRAVGILVFAVITSFPAIGRQTGPERDVVSVPFTSDRWRIDGAADAVRFEQFRGREAVRLQGGALILDDVDFRNGTIEFDMAFPHGRGFHGVSFRIENDREYEHFYFRSHLSGMPDANQYQPVIGGSAAWQLLHGEPYSSATVYPENEWIHVRLVVQGDSAEIYVDSSEPEVTFRLRSRAASGGLAVDGSGLNPVWYADFSYSLSDESLRGSAAGIVAPPEGSVTTWEVSTPVTEQSVSGDRLDAGEMSEGSWRLLEAEENGVVNLARIIDDKVADGRDRSVTNTVIARLRIASDAARSVPVQFGYSDRVRVFMNGRQLYAGDNGYQSRDYRYLGTIGLFDTVWLDLADGENLLEFAVSEDFGGWGLMARFPDQDGLTFENGAVVQTGDGR